jgi:hypothetical protein
MIRRTHLRESIMVAALLGISVPAAAAPPEPAYSAAGLYNLANSYAIAGKPGMAVLYYERARLLAPNDPDIEANLRYVQASSRLAPESSSWIERVGAVGSPNELSWAGVIGWSIMGISMVAGRRYSGYRWTRRIAFILGSALIGLTVSSGLLLWPRLHQAVIVKDAAPVLVSPVPMADTLFVLPEASTVETTAEHEGFVLVQTASGQTGWVSRANLVRVVPQK